MSQVVPTPPLARRVARGAAALALGVAILTACGDDPADSETAATTAETSSESASPTTGTESTSAEAGETQTITATEEDFSISLEDGALSAGTYEIEVVNDGDATHDLVVERDGEDVETSETINPGGTTTVTVTLEPGDYVFYCSVGNHRSMGMETPVSVS